MIVKRPARRSPRTRRKPAKSQPPTNPLSSRRAPSSPAPAPSRHEWPSILKALETLLSTHTPPDPIVFLEKAPFNLSPSPSPAPRSREDEKENKSSGAPAPTIDKATLAAIDAAYTATLRHYIALLDGSQADPRAQKHISQLWQKAGTALRRNDPALADRLKARHPFWSTPSTWSRDTIRKVWPTLNAIRAYTNRTDPEVAASLRWGHALST